MVNDQISLTIDGVVAQIVIDRAAKRNAFTLDMIHQFDRVLGEIEELEIVRVVTIEGAGGASFSSGEKKLSSAPAFLQPLKTWG